MLKILLIVAITCVIATDAVARGRIDFSYYLDLDFGAEWRYQFVTFPGGGMHPVSGMPAGASAAAQTPEELYGEYLTPETRAIMERFEEAERRSQEAEAAAKARRTLALCVAILIGLIPLGYIGRDIIRKKSWKNNPDGTLRALGTGLAGGVVLFGFNYGIFLLKIKMGDAFNTALAFLIVAALIAGSIYLLKK